MPTTKAWAKSRGLAVAAATLFVWGPFGQESRAQAQAALPGAAPAAGRANAIGPNGGANLLVILMAPTVQKELKLTEAQKTRVYDLTREAGGRVRDMFQSMMQTGGGFNPQAMLLAGARLRQEHESTIHQLLDKTQRERFEQIVLQVEGAFALARPELAEELRLSEKQTQQVQGTLVQMQIAQRQMLMNARASGAMDNMQLDQIAQATGKVREAAGKQLAGILNGKQKAAFNRLCGEPFDLSELDPNGKHPAAPATATAKAEAKPEAKAEAKSDAGTSDSSASDHPRSKPTRKPGSSKKSGKSTGSSGS